MTTHEAPGTVPSNMDYDYLPLTQTALPVVGVAIILWLLTPRANSRDKELLKSHPSIGLGNTWLSWSKAVLGSLISTKSWVFEGYSKFSKQNRLFVLPTIDRGGLLVIPPRLIRTLYGLSDDVMDIKTTGNNTIQTRWTIWDDEVSENNFQMNVIRNQITRNLNVLTPPIAEELAKAFDREWGTDQTNWKTVSVWTSALRLIAGAANGAFCGPPLCRDENFLDRLRDHAMCVFGGALLINATPGPLRWISGYLVGWTSYFLFLRVRQICLPHVKERLEQTGKLRSDPTYDWTPPQDGLQWLVEESFSMNDPAQLNPKRITHRLVFMNDISMHSTSYTVQNLILDLATADPSLGYIEALRAESARVLKEAGGSWTRQAVTKLELVDSAVRESMRLTPFNSVGLPRTVISPHGITVEQGKGESFHVPQGTILAIPVEPIHFDEMIYPNAKQFQPFRFTQPGAVRDIIDDAVSASSTGEAVGSNGHVTGTSTTPAAIAPQESGQEPKKKSATVDDAFLGFGFGRHACPGRFFAINEVKIFVAHMVLHYDIEHLREGRASMTPLIWLNVPLFNKFNVRVRRREPVELLA